MTDEPTRAKVPAGERTPSALRGAVWAAALLVPITLLRLGLDRLLGRPTPFLLYLVPIMVGAWHGGLRVGVGATVVAALVGHYLFDPPAMTLALPHGHAAAQLAFFVAQGLAISAIIARSAGDRRRALVAAREGSAALDKLHAVLDAVDDGIVVQDAVGRVLYANEVAAHTFGKASVADLLGVSAAAGLADVEISGDDGLPLPREQMPGRTALRTREAVERVLRFRATATGVERWCAVRSKPLYDAEGRPSSVISLLHDVTRRRRDEARAAFVARAAQELASSLDYPTTLSRVARLAVPEVADRATVDLAEDGRLARLAAAPASDEDATDLAAEVLRTGRPSLLDDGGRRSSVAVPLTVRGAPMGVLTFATEESGRRYTPDDLALATSLAERASVAIEHAVLYREAEQARADAELANRSKDEFLAMLGHELRNPLAPILTALALIRMRGNAAWPERELAVIDRQVKHLVRLVDDLLDVSRITRGRVELKLERLALADVAARAVEMSLPLIEQRAHRLDVEVPAELAVRGDAVRLAQVVANLLNNAAKYSEKGGRIEVRAARDGAWVELRVRDRGIGIAPGMLPRIFDLFTQESQALDRAQGGLGLGLAIVKSLVALHGGEVSAASDGPAQGSEFRVRLPALDDDAPAPAADMDVGADEAVGAARVLVVDDNEDAADLLAEALAVLGHDVRKAHDGPSALALAAGFLPTVAVLDIGLPVMDGHELARRLRAMEGLAGLRLIAVTGYGQDADRARTAEAGFDAHLVKPVDLAALAALIPVRTPRPPGAGR